MKKLAILSELHSIPIIFSESIFAVVNINKARTIKISPYSIDKNILLKELENEPSISDSGKYPLYLKIEKQN